ncbi:MAG: beta-aspartyl-peptidase [Clostridiales bacterium]|nr:beta-aspartyl-peptidase [Clostridiales bacterium]
MDLELRNIQIRDVVLGEENRLSDGVLTVDAAALQALLLEDPRVKSARIDLAKPGESCRILPVKDVIEPRAKETGDIFPGVFGTEVPEVGSGVTYVLKGCAVVTTGPIVGFQEGLIDMSGPAAPYTLFSKLNNIVLHLTKREDIDPHEHEEVVRKAGLKAAAWIGKIAVGCAEYESEIYHWPSLGERTAQYPGLPKVAYVCNCMAQGLLHDTYFYGRDAKQLVPTLVSPNEFCDGAIVSGNCVSPGSKTTTYHHLNNAVIKALMARHGKDLNFVGIVLNPLMVTLKEKQRDIMLSVHLVTEELGAEAAIISQEGFGNPTTDLMHVCRGLEKRGVKTVIITNEDAGTDGMSESLPDVVTEANAIVSTGNSNATILLPHMDRVLGELKEVERVTGGNVDSIRPDGTLLLEIHGIMGGHNLQGNTYLSATTV